MKPLPDPYPIEPLTKPPNCTITVPGSKSITNRALILAALAEGKCTLRGALWADDTQVMVDSLQKLGFEVTVEPDPGEECNRTITVVGRGGEIPAKKAELYVGNAGTAARFLTALVCLGHGEYTIRGDERMHERPMKDLLDALKSLGVEIQSSNDRLPAKIHAKGLKGGEVTVNLTDSTQFASALMLISNRAKLQLNFPKWEMERGYLTMTDIMTASQFPSDYLIEPDLSSASYFLGAAYLCGGKVEIAGLTDESLQIDWKFPYVLESASKTNPSDYAQLLDPPLYSVSRVLNLGDSVMTLAVCAPFFPTGLWLKDARNMRNQETDRIKALATELENVGAKVEELDDGLKIWTMEQTPQAGMLAPLSHLHGADIETYNDHRMAMCFAVLGLKVPGIRIKNPGCVSKTFPNFFEKLEQLRK